MSSSKFNPSYRRRQPPPQCKKSKPNPLRPNVTDPVGSLAGQYLLVDWTWREAGENPSFEFGQHGYVLIDTSNHFVSTDDQGSGNEASVSFVWNHQLQHWTISCDLLLSHLLIATTTNIPIPYTGRNPFSVPMRRIDTITIAGSYSTILTISISS